VLTDSHDQGRIESSVESATSGYGIKLLNAHFPDMDFPLSSFVCFDSSVGAGAAVFVASPIDRAIIVMIAPPSIHRAISSRIGNNASIKLENTKMKTSNSMSK
jgi:hypothetical protein